MQKKGKGKRERDLQPLVKSVLGQVSKRYSVLLIRPDLKLRDLGLESTEILDLKTKLYRTVAGKDVSQFKQFADALSINPNSTVRQVVDKFAKAPVPSRSVSLAGDDTTTVKGDDAHIIGTAVRVAVAQAAACPFAKVGPNLKLSDAPVTFDSSAIAGLKTGLVQMFSGSEHPTRFKDLSTQLQVDPDSTVQQIIDRSVSALLPGDGDTHSKGADEAGLPGDDDTKVKGGD